MLTRVPSPPRYVPQAIGSSVNHSCTHSFGLLMSVGSLVSCGIALALVGLGSWLGRSFEGSSEAGTLIGDERADGDSPYDEEDRALVVSTKGAGELGDRRPSELQMEALNGGGTVRKTDAQQLRV